MQILFERKFKPSVSFGCRCSTGSRSSCSGRCTSSTGICRRHAGRSVEIANRRQRTLCREPTPGTGFFCWTRKSGSWSSAIRSSFELRRILGSRPSWPLIKDQVIYLLFALQVIL